MQSERGILVSASTRSGTTSETQPAELRGFASTTSCLPGGALGALLMQEWNGTSGGGTNLAITRPRGSNSNDGVSGRGFLSNDVLPEPASTRVADGSTRKGERPIQHQNSRPLGHLRAS